MNDKPRIFISYATEDRPHAIRLQKLLLDADYEPRMDIEILTPGTEWEERLQREIPMADFFLFCLSPQAISKNGVQFQELKLAQRIWEKEKRGDRELYIIPVHLVECDPVESLRDLQFVRLYELEGETKLLNALREEVERWRGRREAWDSHRRKFDPAIVNLASAVIEITVNSALPSIDWVRVLHVNTGAMKEPGRFPKNVEAIHQWTWRQSAHVRWRNVELQELDTELSAVNLIVLDWSTNYLDKAEIAFKKIREMQTDLPMLILISDLNLDQYPNRRDLIAEDSADGGTARSIVISEREWNDDAGIDSAFRRLNVSLSPYELSLNWEERHLAVKEVIEWSEDERHLRISVQKFFPAAKHAWMEVFGGGGPWGRVCRLFVDGNSYLFKLFKHAGFYQAQLEQHPEIAKWLGDAALPMQAIPELHAPADQRTPFPAPPALYPICSLLGPSHGRPLTLKECYRSSPVEFKEEHSRELDDLIDASLKRLLNLLAAGQPDRALVPQMPWGKRGESPFDQDVLKSGVLATLDDLELYGRRLYGDFGKWKNCRDKLRLIFQDRLPAWLREYQPVVTGHIHGSPIADNCLINPANPQDLRLIECGGYLADGRLVSDLAMIECDLKYALMCTDDDAEGLFDLESSALREWCQAEAGAIERKLEYSVGAVPSSPKCIHRAYRLVSEVRERAKKISIPHDKDGRHYFAALLFWTLDGLTSPTARPTKKLLALHSAAEIVRVFDP